MFRDWTNIIAAKNWLEILFTKFIKKWAYSQHGVGNMTIYEKIDLF